MLAFIMFDPLYFIVLAPAMLLAFLAEMRVRSAYARAGRIPASSRLSGAEVARRILNQNGLHDVAIEPSHGLLSDHYDPRKRVLRLSPDVYQGRSLASVGIAAHEAGHAIQHGVHYGPLALRNGLVPLASTGSSLAMIVFVIGMFLSAMPLGRTLMVLAILMFGTVVVFQLVNLPVEFNASRRAMVALTDSGIVGVDEVPTVRRVLNAAAMTYVAATLSAMLTLLYLVLRSGLLGGRRN